MAIPDYQSLMLPMLEMLADGQVKRVVPELTDPLAARFQLIASDIEQMLPSGASTTFRNRLHWAATYMVKAGLLTRPKRGKLRITSAARTCWRSSPREVDITVLSRFPEFVGFRTKKNSARREARAETTRRTPRSRSTPPTARGGRPSRRTC